MRRGRRVEIDLDPALKSRRGLGAIERNSVSVETVSTADAVTRWLAMAETPLPATGEGGPGELVRSQPLPIHDLELTRVSAKDDEVRANITFMVVRVHDLDTGEEGE